MGCQQSKDALPSEPTRAQQKAQTSPVKIEHTPVVAAAISEAASAQSPEPRDPVIPLSQPPPKAKSFATISLDDDLAEVDRLLHGTKSEIRSKPLDLESGLRDSSSNNVTSIQPIGISSSSNVVGIRDPLPSSSSIPLPTQPISPQQQQQQQQASAEPDPWASLQSAYRIRDDRQAEDIPTSTRQVLLEGSPLGSGPGRGLPTGRSSEVVVLDDDEEGGRIRPVQPAGRRGTLPPLPPGKQGGWGNGTFAAAGTLMLGDETELVSLAPPAGAQGASVRGLGRQGSSQSPYGQDELVAPSPPLNAKSKVVTETTLIEDIEDVDELLKEVESGSNLNPNLAARLAAFDALADDD